MDLKVLVGKVDISTNGGVDSTLLLTVGYEEEVNTNLELLLSKQCQIDSKMSGFGCNMIAFNLVCINTKNLNSQIERTAQLAESVSAKVRRLDLARARASECQQRVHDLIDLQLCSRGVLTAISTEDYEKGAGHIARFLAMDQLLLQRTADDVQGSVTSVSNAVKTLEGATEKLRERVAIKFDDAVKTDDLASVERFFKIFPLLGQHKDGIDKFSQYISSKLAVKARKELHNALNAAKAEKRQPVAYADTMTLLLENFARVIEVNQPIIETCYGAGYLKNMVAILQKECDCEIKNLILEFNEYRQIQRRMQQVKDFQHAASAVSSSIGAGIQGLGHYRKPSGSMDKLNPKDIDTVIAEIAIMHARAEMYFRFMRRKVMADIESSNQKKKEQKCNAEELDQLLRKSNLSRQMQELLDTYLLLERYFVEESLLKAISLDTYEAGMQCSSMVDDVFFILRKTIRRSLKTQSVNGTCAVINNAVTCLDGDFMNMLKMSLKSGYPSGYIDLAQAYNVLQNSLQQGKLQSSDTEKARSRFLVALNNADISTEYIETLWETIQQEFNSTFPVISEVERRIIENCLSELKMVRDALKACVDFGMQQLRSSAIKPRLNPWVDRFLSYNHYLTEEELAVYEAGETFVQFLIVKLDGLLNSFKNTLTPRNYDALVSILAAEMTTRLERAIKSSTFNRMGGIVLDQEVRLLGTYLTGITSWSVRDKIARLIQISTLLNLEKVSELADYWNPDNGSDTHSWRLTPNEVKTILTLRSDFRMEDIKRIDL